MKKMYFIAIYPPQEIIDEVKVFKKDLASNYNNSKALKNDAHITLFPPFERELDLENDIHVAFQKIDTNIPPFEITLNGFGSFPNPKNPVLYIEPEENQGLTDLHSRVKERFNFKNYSFHPHVTVGYRDLTWENYVKAWEVYNGKEFKTKFTVDKITLLRHDGKWVPIAEKKLSSK
ncbi:RNA 2',3'-cyclic phosphodiesterase [Chryseobacterium sp. PBS4-4]|uniref:RNA 2',3'-cyclic phosphodiesterase n=1 Tax=Chryseobacterium edaphi TaxID=2976532 RepID=A0ABT2W854_9FLAO|nr:RNA 2',3'-cyclic phosphodiesterase [Chryseobacterium edaphi]MCU7618381.1 RNA 2',3'-cyclic phosphodiesterase [Chryseobacterium edaphi]